MTVTYASATAIHGSVSPYLRHIDPASRDSINSWLASHDIVRFRVDNREFELVWSEPFADGLQVGLALAFGGRELLLALDGFAAVDPLLVGEPFANMPVSLRDFIVARVMAQFLALLPAGLADAIDLRAVHWNTSTFPRRDCVVGFTLARFPEGPQTQGILAADCPATLDWLSRQLPAVELHTTGRLSGLPMMMPIFLGTTLLSPAAIRGVEPGDVVWIETGHHRRDGIAATLASPAGVPQWNCRIKRGGLVVVEPCARSASLMAAASPVSLGAGYGGTGVETPFPSSGETMNETRAALEIPVTFDLGQLTVPLRDLEALHPGYLFDLPCEVANATVNLRVSGTLVAEGKLVVIGRRLGVRIATVRAVE
jgi:type III secretion protein Q